MKRAIKVGEEFVYSTARFMTEQSGVLSFEERQLIRVVSKPDDKWWVGYLVDLKDKSKKEAISEEGLFPASFTAPYNEDEGFLSIEEAARKIMRTMEDELLTEAFIEESQRARMGNGASKDSGEKVRKIIMAFKFRNRLRELAEQPIEEILQFLHAVSEEKIDVPYQHNVVTPVIVSIQNVLQRAVRAKIVKFSTSRRGRGKGRTRRRKLSMMVRQRQDGSVPDELGINLDRVKNVRVKRRISNLSVSYDQTEASEMSEKDSDVGNSSVGGMTSGTEGAVRPPPPPMLDDEYDDAHIYFEGDDGIPDAPDDDYNSNLYNYDEEDIFYEGENNIPPPPPTV